LATAEIRRESRQERKRLSTVSYDSTIVEGSLEIERVCESDGRNRNVAKAETVAILLHALHMRAAT
jgi:hypothetical protein